MQFAPTLLFLSRFRNSLFTKSLSPKFCSICLGDPERVSLEEATGENAFEFCQHVTEYQRQLGQVPPAKDHKSNCFFQKKRVYYSEQSRTSTYCNLRMIPACKTLIWGSLSSVSPALRTSKTWELPARSVFDKTFSTMTNSV